jgi:antitoxin component of MazEF toxin-antitoxin module
MTKTLQPIGNSLGLVIDQPILKQLGITATTPLEVTVTSDGQGLLIRPVGNGEAGDHKARVRAAAERVTGIHHETLKKLAES